MIVAVGYWPGMTVAFVGISGLILSLFHSAPGFQLATLLGLRDASTDVRGMEHVYIEALNAAVWAPVYGAVGFLLDRRYAFRSS